MGSLPVLALVGQMAEPVPCGLRASVRAAGVAQLRPLESAARRRRRPGAVACSADRSAGGWSGGGRRRPAAREWRAAVDSLRVRANVPILSVGLPCLGPDSCCVNGLGLGNGRPWAFFPTPSAGFKPEFPSPNSRYSNIAVLFFVNACAFH